MSSQLLGANASLNAPGGFPGAAPTVVQGGLVVNGSLALSGSVSLGPTNVNGLFTVTKPDTPGTLAVNFTDGNAGAAENGFQVYLNGTNTEIKFVDSGNNGGISFEGSTNSFNFDKAISGSTSAANPDYVGGFTVLAPDAGSLAVNITDGNSGAAENGLQVYLNGTSTDITFVDNGNTGNIAFQGAGTQPQFSTTQPISHPVVQADTRTGITTGVAMGGINGITASSVVMVTMVANSVAIVPFSIVLTDNTVTPTFAGGGTATFNYFVAKY